MAYYQIHVSELFALPRQTPIATRFPGYAAPRIKLGAVLGGILKFNPTPGYFVMFLTSTTSRVSGEIETGDEPNALSRLAFDKACLERRTAIGLQPDADFSTLGNSSALRVS